MLSAFNSLMKHQDFNYSYEGDHDLWWKIHAISFNNPLSTNPTKWSNKLKQFVSNSRRVVWVCLTILWGWGLKEFEKSCFQTLTQTTVVIFSHRVKDWSSSQLKFWNLYPLSKKYLEPLQTSMNLFVKFCKKCLHGYLTEF